MFLLDPGDQVLRSSIFVGFPWLRHGFGTRHTAPAWPHGTAILKQIHSDLIHAVRQEVPHNNTCEGDALITAEPGASLSIRTADCVPILLADPEHRAVAAVHAGWRGTQQRIVAKTVARMQAEYGVHPDQILAAIGPAIGPCCYEVSQDVAAQFAEYLPEWLGLGKTHLDLIGINRAQLLGAGVHSSRIDMLDACTRCGEDLYHSFRRDAERSGRMHAVIGLMPRAESPV